MMQRESFGRTVGSGSHHGCSLYYDRIFSCIEDEARHRRDHARRSSRSRSRSRSRSGGEGGLIAFEDFVRGISVFSPKAPLRDKILCRLPRGYAAEH